MAITRVSRISSAAPTAAVSSATNTSKTLQNQLQMKQQTLNKLSNNPSMDAAEKEKQRQRLQAEIEELKRKLEMMRLKQEEAQKANSVEKKEEIAKTQAQTEEQEKVQKFESSEPVELSTKEIHQMLDRNFTLKEDMIQQGVAYDKENKVRRLTSEIRQDELYGADTSTKEKELEDLLKQENPLTKIMNQEETPKSQPLINPDVQVIIE